LTSRHAFGSRPVSAAREPERDSSGIRARARLAVVGRGRLGSALAVALAAAGCDVTGPFGRGFDGRCVDQRGVDEHCVDERSVGKHCFGKHCFGKHCFGKHGFGKHGVGRHCADAVLLCVPDAEIAAAASLISPGPLVGHCSGATTLAPLAPHEAFSLHPLMTVTPQGARFAGAGAAIAGSTPRATALAAELAAALGMRAVVVADKDRAAYHAAASIASNLLVTLEAAAERIAATAGVDRELLVPLVRASVENWAALGPEHALTGPIARGDEATVARQRAAVAERAPDLLAVFDALAEATRALAGAGVARRGGQERSEGGRA
jgi:predicted short-subunit dehydrogenase-like oxidoreductase (DUF2520 family)